MSGKAIAGVIIAVVLVGGVITYVVVSRAKAPPARPPRGAGGDTGATVQDDVKAGFNFGTALANAIGGALKKSGGSSPSAPENKAGSYSDAHYDDEFDAALTAEGIA